MNSIYKPSKDIYTIKNEICYENKIMKNDEKPHPQESVRVNLQPPQNEESGPAASKCNCFRRMRRRPLPYILDHLIFIVVTILLILVELGFLPQAKIGFYCKDPSISFKFTGDTIKVSYLLTGCFLGPIFLILFVEFSRSKITPTNSLVKTWWYMYRHVLIGTLFVLSVTEIAKSIFGEHRPHFLDVCKPDANLECTKGDFVTSYKCTSDFKTTIISDASRSFPSGHSSVSAYISIFCVFIVYERLPKRTLGLMFKLLLIIMCIAWTIACSLTRITDRRHHWWDVLGGFSMGALVAYLQIKLYLDKIRNKLGTPVTSSTTLLLGDMSNRNT